MPIVIAHGIVSLPSAVVLKTAKDNYVDDIASDMEYDFVVPAGKMWWVYGGWTERLGTTVFQVLVFDEDDQEILHSKGSDYGSVEIDWGVFADYLGLMTPINVPFPLSAGQYVRYKYSKNPYNSSVSLLVLEEDA